MAWQWNAKRALWLRTQNGEADTDTTGAQLSASNVIVQFIGYATSGYVTGEGAAANGGAIPDGQMVGSGTAWYLSGGAMAKGTWTRASLTSRTVYKDAAGAPVELQPGRTWVELARAGTVPTTTP